MLKARNSMIDDERRNQREGMLAANRNRFLSLRAAVEVRQQMTEEEIDQGNLVNSIKKMEIEPIHKNGKSKTRNGHSEYEIHDYLQKSSFLSKNTIIEDLEDEWIIIPKPVGERVLVVAAGGFTQIVFKDSSCKVLQTGIKGGNRETNTGCICLLDAIFSQNKTLFILDAIILEESPVYEECAEVRNYFLQSKIPSNLQYITETNRMSIILVPRVEATARHIRDPQSVISGVDIDGFLLVDKTSFYMLGEMNEDSYWIKPRPKICETVIAKLLLRFNEKSGGLESKDGEFMVLLTGPRVSQYKNGLFSTTTMIFETRGGIKMTLADKIVYRVFCYLGEGGSLIYEVDSRSDSDPMSMNTAKRIVTGAQNTTYDDDLAESVRGNIVCE